MAADAPLMSAGLDSIAGTEFTNTLAQQFEIELPPTLLFDYPTIESMAGFIAETMLTTMQVEASSDSRGLPRWLALVSSLRQVLCHLPQALKLPVTLNQQGDTILHQVNGLKGLSFWIPGTDDTYCCRGPVLAWRVQPVAGARNVLP